MGIFYEGVTWLSLLTFVLFVAAWVLINEVARRSKIASAILFGLAPIVLAILVLSGVLGSPSGKTWFGWVKVISALTGVYGFMLIRFTKLGKGKFAMIFPLAILSLNIAEAVYREFEVFATYTSLTVEEAGNLILGGPWNIINAISGILCIVTLTGFVGIRAAKDKTQDMIWPDMTWIYVVAYTLWNYSYVYNCISMRSLYSGATILIAAMIAEFFFKRGAWLQHRAQILALYAMFALSWEFQKFEGFQITVSEDTYTSASLLTIALVAFVFNVGAFVYMLVKIKKTKRNPLKEELYTDLKYYKRSIADSNL